MPKVWAQDGFKFYVYPNDHKPSHIHIKKAGKEIVINIGDTNTKPNVREIRGMDLKDMSKALRITAERQEFLLIEWRRIHG